MATKTDDPILRELVLEYCREKGRATLNANAMHVGQDWPVSLQEFNAAPGEYTIKAIFTEPPQEGNHPFHYRRVWWFRAIINRKTGEITSIRV